MRLPSRFLVLLALGAVLVPAGARGQTTEFARLVDRLSEPGGYFNSDNLVSNETSYLHVLGAFRERRLRGGAYVGVGPEQGLSYIAATRPAVAIVIDIRRDNLLLHLLLKAMFETARNRMEYLCLLYGRPLPDDLFMWTDLPLGSLLDWLDRTPMYAGVHDRNHRLLMDRVTRYGIPLSDQDRTTLRRFHDEFAQMGLDLRYTSRGRAPRLSFPTVRRLYLETDLEGHEASYLSTEDRWRIVRDLERADRLVPVVGDLAGPHAVQEIGAYLRELELRVSVFYVSNVESYLFRYGTFPAFVANVRTLPSGPNSVLVRSWFSRGAAAVDRQPGHFSIQRLQMFERFLALTREPERLTYWELAGDAASALPVPIPRP